MAMDYMKPASFGTQAQYGALGALGGALGNIGGGFFGKPGRWGQQKTVSPLQEQAVNQQLQQGMQNTNWDDIQKQYENQFQSQTIPGLAEMYTSFGNNSNQGSSAQLGAMGAAGADLSSQLAALKSQFGMNQLQFGMHPTFENYYTPAKPGMLQGAMGGLASLLPMLGMMGGPGGRMGGTMLSKLLGATGG